MPNPTVNILTFRTLCDQVKKEARISGSDDLDQFVKDTINDELLSFCLNNRFFELLVRGYNFLTVAANNGLYPLPPDFQHMGLARYWPLNATRGYTINKVTDWIENPVGGLPKYYQLQQGLGVQQTTIAAGSNGAVLPQATISVTSTTGFLSAGNLVIQLAATAGQQTVVSYTGKTSSTFTGCTGGTGTLATNMVVQSQPVGQIYFLPNADIPDGDSIYFDYFAFPPQLINDSDLFPLPKIYDALKRKVIYRVGLYSTPAAEGAVAHKTDGQDAETRAHPLK